MKALLNPVLVASGLLGVSAFTSDAQTNATKIAAGDAHTVFVAGNGSLWAMGNNNSGQLGDGSTNNINFPAEIVGGGIHLGSNSPPTVTAVGARYEHTMFIESDGSLWAMGDNKHGEFGNGTLNNSDVPVEILTNQVTALAVGAGHTLFLKKHGSGLFTAFTDLWVMGLNNDGQLGDGSTVNTNRPELIESDSVENNGSVIRAIAAGDFHSLFLKSDGSLWAMGSNDQGQFGDGTASSSSVRKEILDSGVSAIAAAYNHSFIIKSDGSLWSSGENDYGELGNGTMDEIVGFTKIVTSNVTAVAAGTSCTFFIKSDGSLWGMGDAGTGQLNGLGMANQLTPLLIVDSGVTAAAAGDYHSLFLLSDGSLWGMGDDTYGALGDYTLYFTPYEIIGPVIPNGGFETGDLLGWDIDWLEDTNYVSRDPRYAHSGTFGLRMPPPAAETGSLAQTLRTIPGANYRLSFWLNCDGTTPNGFAALWNGTNLFSSSDVPNLGWTNLQFTVSATESNTFLEFQFTNSSSYFGLDDVSAVQLVQPVITGISVAGTNLLLNVANGLAAHLYLTLMGTNLTEPVGQWTPVATNTLSTTENFIVALTNAVDTRARQRFYLIEQPQFISLGP